MKCANDHEIPEGKKFCVECGEKPQETMAKCAACQAEHPVGQKFCAECGETLVKATREELDEALAELAEFHKAKTELEETPDVADTEQEDLLLKAKVKADEVDPVATVLCEAHNRTIDHLIAYGADTRATRREMGELGGLLRKAVSIGLRHIEGELGGRLDALTERMDTWEGMPGRRRSARIAPLHKSNVGESNDPGEDDDSLAGAPLVKAAIDAEVAGKIGQGDSTQVEYWVNRGLTMKGIKAAVPDLGFRLESAGLGATKH
jgi:hypothetical protein